MAEWTQEWIGPAPRIAVERMGSGPMVLFMHGIAGNSASWHLQLPAIGEHFHAVAWDARGYGASDDYDGPLEFGDFAGDVARVLDHYGVEKVHICGHSMGGRIAQDFYPRHPDRVATLILCDTFPGFEGDPDKNVTQSVDEFVNSRIKPILDGKDMGEIARQSANRLMGPNRSEDAYQRSVAISAARHIESYIKTVRASASFDRLADLPHIKVPTLLVYGDVDPLTPPEVGRHMAEVIENSKFVLIEDSGHMANIERPEPFNQAVLAFLNEHRNLAH